RNFRRRVVDLEVEPLVLFDHAVVARDLAAGDLDVVDRALVHHDAARIGQRQRLGLALVERILRAI
uniref:hypothetical protein n=1 Tax=Pseudomonas sp. EA_5y_Pfl2_R50 TaxID=3088691 RepID=UPI0030D9D9AA